MPWNDNDLCLYACSLIAYLRDEEGAADVEALLLDRQNICLTHAVNLCEVYYDFLRISDEQVAQEAVADLLTIGLVVREDMDISFWQAVGKLKTQHNISLADCFAIALTQQVSGTLITSDHHEFEPIAEAGICTISCFR